MSLFSGFLLVPVDKLFFAANLENTLSFGLSVVLIVLLLAISWGNFILEAISQCDFYFYLLRFHPLQNY